MKPETLRKRREFLRVRGGRRWSSSSFLIEAKTRPDEEARAPNGPRFGFTVTKKLGNAVARNRIRRRLKAAIGQVANTGAKHGTDYVIVARSAAAEVVFSRLVADFERAFERLHAARSDNGGRDAKPYRAAAVTQNAKGRRRGSGKSGTSGPQAPIK